MRRNYSKIERNITLSIQYARLLEELGETEQKRLTLKDKKGVAVLRNKRIDTTTAHVEEVNRIIKDIETKNKKKEYTIITNNDLDKYLQRLSHHEFFEIFKFNIALNTLLDSSTTYLNSEKYLERISELLFQDKYAMQKMKKDIAELCVIFDNTVPDNKVADAIKKLPVNINMASHMFKGKMKFLSKPMVLNIAFTAVGTGHKILKKRAMVRKFKRLSDTEFDYILITTLLSLNYAKNVLPEDVKRKYFSSKLQAINLTRTTLTKQLYEDFYDVKENVVKVKQLNTFDNYLIDEMKFHV